jgi:hypothetical protein
MSDPATVIVGGTAGIEAVAAKVARLAIWGRQIANRLSRFGRLSHCWPHQLVLRLQVAPRIARAYPSDPVSGI